MSLCYIWNSVCKEMPFNLGVSSLKICHTHQYGGGGGNKSIILNNWTLPFHKISATTILEVIVGPSVAAPLRLLSAFFCGTFCPRN